MVYRGLLNDERLLVRRIRLVRIWWLLNNEGLLVHYRMAILIHLRLTGVGNLLQYLEVLILSERVVLAISPRKRCLGVAVEIASILARAVWS